jgi:integrase
MIPADIPLLADVQGLRHRARADGTLRVWWEPSAQQRKAGAKPVDLSHLRPGEALRRARQLAATTQQAKAPRGRSIDGLIISYRESRFFTELRSTTRESYSANLRAIAEKWGPQPPAALTSAMMDIWYEALLREKGTHRALALLTMMRILFGFAETRGWIAKGSNPATNLRMTKPQPRDRVATDAERAAIWAAAASDADVALPLALALLTGQRQTDILAAQVADFVAQPLLVPGRIEPQPAYVWQLRQSKRGRVVPVPIMDPEAVALLDAAMAARTGPLVINTSTGRRFLKRNFAERWEAVRAIAAQTVPSVATLQWRDLRRTVSVGLRTAGMGRDDAGDLLGNTLAASSTLAQTYTPATLATTLRAVGAITPLPQRKKA